MPKFLEQLEQVLGARVGNKDHIVQILEIYALVAACDYRGADKEAREPFL